MKHLKAYKIFESETYKDPIDVESDAPGAIAVPARLLLDILKTF